MSDYSELVWNVHQRFIEVASGIEYSWTRPSVLYKPRIFQDGSSWCCLLGEDIQSGVVGFGDTPELACIAFDKTWAHQLVRPEQSTDTRKWGLCYRDGGRIWGTLADTESAAWARLDVSEEEGRARGYYAMRVSEKKEDRPFRVGHGHTQTQRRAQEMQDWADRSLQSQKRIGDVEKEAGE